MFRSIYASGTAMLTQERRLDVISNNIANANTTGFKEDEMISRSFRDELISRLDETTMVNKVREVGPYNHGIHVDQVVTDFRGGTPISTDNYTDAAIEGDGFFVFNTPQGERYSRNGVFRVTNDGVLVNQDDFPLQGENGDITVGAGSFTINRVGEIYNNEGELIDRIRLVSFDDNSLLRKEGNNLYYNTDANMQESTASIRQGYIEASNVDGVTAMVEMIKTYRNYETNQRVIQSVDAIAAKTVELGRV
ncbi:MAG: flagellar hook-basal body protein [Oscillospiraceae bacterium]|nr:flagellar hook-basal body protein [Oscillospiraceae bacterium]